MSEKSTEKYNEIFPKKYSLITAIHAFDLEQVLKNMKIAIDNGADGVFLVDHEANNREEFISITKLVREVFDKLWIGVNMISDYPDQIFHYFRGSKIDGVRVDNPFIPEVNGINRTTIINNSRRINNFQGLYFGGVAFKHQKEPEDLGKACEASKIHMDVITTSGEGTGIQASFSNIEKMSNLVGDFPLALASGVSSNNIRNYRGVRSFIVATSISSDFYNLSPDKVKDMARILEDMNR